MVPENWENILDHPPLKKRTEKSRLGNQRRLGVDHVDGEKSKSDLGSNPPKMQLLQMKGLAWSSQTQRRYKRHRGGDKPEGGEPRSDLKMELVDRNFILKMENPKKKIRDPGAAPAKNRRNKAVFPSTHVSLKISLSLKNRLKMTKSNKNAESLGICSKGRRNSPNEKSDESPSPSGSQSFIEISMDHWRN